MHRALVKDQPHVPAYQDGLASALTYRGNVLKDAGRHARGAKCYTEAAELGRALVKDRPGMLAYQDDLARTLNNLAALQRLSGPARGGGEGLHRGGRTGPRPGQGSPGAARRTDLAWQAP